MATEQEAAEASARVFAEAFMKVLRDRLRIELVQEWSYNQQMPSEPHAAVKVQIVDVDPLTGAVTPFLQPVQKIVLEASPWGKPTLKVVY